MKTSETHLLYSGVIRHKLVELAKGQSIAICGVVKINPGFEQRVIDTYDPSQSEHVVVHDKFVVVDVVIFVSIDENHVELFTGGG